MSNQLKYQFSAKELCQQICGLADTRLAYIEKLLELRLIPRGNSLLLQSNSQKKIDFALSFFESLEEQHKETTKNGGDFLEFHDWKSFYKGVKTNLMVNKESTNHSLLFDKEAIFITARGRPAQVKNPHQMQYVDSLLSKAITIAIGPAGTGKTFLSIATACSLITTGKRARLIITRPAVEAGESLGFLPGDLEQKIDPYLRPLYDALYECLSKKQVDEMISNRQIEVAPLAYMRGRTLNDAVVLLDESQNCTLAQLKMFLTRLGTNSSMCVSGDITQIDLAPGKSGLALLAKVLKPLKELSIIYFESEDIVRNPIVEKIIGAFDKAFVENGKEKEKSKASN